MLVVGRGAKYAHNNEAFDVVNDSQGWSTFHYQADPCYYEL